MDEFKIKNANEYDDDEELKNNRSKEDDDFTFAAFTS